MTQTLKSDFTLSDQIIKTIQSDSMTDPVALQYIPSAAEKIANDKDNSDPIGDETHTVIPGLVHRYPHRALLKITDICAAYCRFCFRKEMVGQGKGVLKKETIDHALKYIRTHSEIYEIILSGGDPLTLSNRRLKDLLTKLDAIEHLDNIRIHTRTPIINPARIDEELLSILGAMKKPIYMVLHVNHAQEINQDIEHVLKKLSDNAIILLSQSVLLKGVNNSVEALENLFRTLIRNRVKPYYLHHLDHAPGTEYFRVRLQEGQDLYRALKKKISGIAMPTYILDIPGGYGKVPLNPTYLTLGLTNTHIVCDHDQQDHIYHD